MIYIKTIRVQQIENTANLLLERHELLNESKIRLNTLVKSMGDITIQKANLKGVDAFTGQYNGKYLICYDDRFCIARKRFTIAHEIGHIELQHFDSEYTNEDWYRKKTDIEANYFAAALLMPASILERYNTYDCEYISTQLSVSLDSLYARINTLNKLSSKQSFKVCGECDSLICGDSHINFCSVCRNKIAI